MTTQHTHTHGSWKRGRVEGNISDESWWVELMSWVFQDRSLTQRWKTAGNFYVFHLFSCPCTKRFEWRKRFPLQIISEMSAFLFFLEGDTAGDQARPDQARPDRIKPDWTGPGRTGLNQARPDRTGLNQARERRGKKWVNSSCENVLFS